LRANADIRLFSRFLDKFDVVSNQPLCSGIFKDFNRYKGEPTCCFMPQDFSQGPAIPHHCWPAAAFGQNRHARYATLNGI
jgi:hypothetical protein